MKPKLLYKHTENALYNACIFSPILARWDNGAFCSELLQVLEEFGYNITIYDSMSILLGVNDFQEALDLWHQTLIEENNGSFDLVIGQAFGGTLVQALLKNLFCSCPKTLLISAPSFVNKILQEKFQMIQRFFSKNCGQEGQVLLEKLTLPLGASICEETARLASSKLTRIEIQRAIKGFSLLQKADVREDVAGYEGAVLSMVGASSQLVCYETIFINQTRKNQIAVSLSGCGMRPIKENPTCALPIIRLFLEGLKI